MGKRVLTDELAKALATAEELGRENTELKRALEIARRDNEQLARWLAEAKAALAAKATRRSKGVYANAILRVLGNSRAVARLTVVPSAARIVNRKAGYRELNGVRTTLSRMIKRGEVRLDEDDRIWRN